MQDFLKIGKHLIFLQLFIIIVNLKL